MISFMVSACRRLSSFGVRLGVVLLVGMAAASRAQMPQHGQELSVPQLLVVVGDSILSTYDLDQLSRLLLLDTNRALTDDNLDGNRSTAWRLLRDTHIFSAYASSQLSEEALQAFMAWLEEQMEESGNAVVFERLRGFGIERDWYRQWMEKVYLWQLYLQQAVAANVTVSSAEIEHEIRRRRRLARVGGARASIVFFPSTNQSRSEDPATSMLMRLKLGANFTTVAGEIIRSEAGQLSSGWVAMTEFEPAVAKAIAETQPGSVYPQPVILAGGSAVVRVEAKIEAGKGRSLQLKRVAVSSEAVVERLRSGNWRCGGNGQTLALANPGLAGTALGEERNLTVVIDSLSAEFQETLAGKASGEVAGPFGSDGQRFMLVICEIIDTAIDKEEIIEELQKAGTEREIDLLQRKLRSQADIRPIGAGLAAPYAALLN